MRAWLCLIAGVAVAFSGIHDAFMWIIDVAGEIDLSKETKPDFNEAKKGLFVLLQLVFSIILANLLFVLGKNFDNEKNQPKDEGKAEKKEDDDKKE